MFMQNTDCFAIAELVVPAIHIPVGSQLVQSLMLFVDLGQVLLEIFATPGMKAHCKGSVDRTIIPFMELYIYIGKAAS